METVCLKLVLVVVIFLASSLMRPSHVAAEPDSDVVTARKFTKQGTAAYNLGQYEEAAEYYQRAYRIVQDPLLLFNIGQSFRLLKKFDKALTAYHSYLRTAPADSPNLAQVEKQVAELETIVATQKDPLVEPSQVPAAPPLAPQQALPNPAPVTDVVPSAPFATPAVTRPEIVSNPNVPLTTAPLYPSEHSPAFYTRGWFWGTVGGVVAAGVVTAVILSAGKSKSNLPNSALGSQGAF
jgi:tetratricopeptide (TPR) repeat protein